MPLAISPEQLSARVLVICLAAGTVALAYLVLTSCFAPREAAWPGKTEDLLVIETAEAKTLAATGADRSAMFFNSHFAGLISHPVVSWPLVSSHLTQKWDAACSLKNSNAQRSNSLSL
jgi:hypothetical protein